MEKIENTLKIWKRGHPSLKGKKHIVQMMVGGQTQYMSNVQGTPDSVEKEIIKIIRNFAWDDKRASINLQMLYQPIDKGGLGFLDIQSRNEAINIMWLKRYLTFGDDRPTWAYVAD